MQRARPHPLSRSRRGPDFAAVTRVNRPSGFLPAGPKREVLPLALRALHGAAPARVKNPAGGIPSPIDDHDPVTCDPVAGLREPAVILPRPNTIGPATLAERNANPFRPPRWRQQMRKIISFAISTMLIVFAISMWAAAKTSHRDQTEIARANIVTFDLMMNAKDLPAHQYDAY
jgi:hypothetical protein